MAVGDVIRRAREAQNIGLRDLARRIGLAPSYLSDIEHDRRSPTEPVLAALCSELPLDPDELAIAAGRLPQRFVDALAADPARAVAYMRAYEYGDEEEDHDRSGGR